MADRFSVDQRWTRGNILRSGDRLILATRGGVVWLIYFCCRGANARIEVFSLSHGIAIVYDRRVISAIIYVIRTVCAGATLARVRSHKTIYNDSCAGAALACSQDFADWLARGHAAEADDRHDILKLIAPPPVF